MRTGGKGEKFGMLLRGQRERSGKSMGALARHLGLTTPYLCDIELGRRAPFSSNHIIKAAEFLGVDAHALLVAATESRDAVEIRTPSTPKGRETVAMLQRRADDFTDEQWERLQVWLHSEGVK